MKKIVKRILSVFSLNFRLFIWVWNFIFFFEKSRYYFGGKWDKLPLESNIYKGILFYLLLSTYLDFTLNSKLDFLEQLRWNLTILEENETFYPENLKDKRILFFWRKFKKNKKCKQKFCELFRFFEKFWYFNLIIFVFDFRRSYVNNTWSKSKILDFWKIAIKLIINWLPILEKNEALCT